MENRKSFYDNELNLERMEEVLSYVIGKLTLKETLKMIREISYDMVCYWDKYNKGIIYQDDDYDEEHIEQACQLQRLLSTACDLFEQSITEKRKFEDGYLDKWLYGGSIQLENEKLKNTITELESRITDLKQIMERNEE